jgi:carbamoyl-phosphate synthase large subunit
MNVLVTGVGGPAGINVLSLMPGDVNVFGCDADQAALDRVKKAGLHVEFFLVPAASEKNFLISIEEVVKNNNIDVVISTVTEELLLLSGSRVHGVVASPISTIRTCNDKYMLYERFRGREFCPQYALPGSGKMEGKVFVKPRIGRGSRGTASFDTMSKIPKEMLTNDFVVCEYLPGTEYTVDAMCGPDGQLVYAVPRARTEVVGGISVRGRTEKHGRILQITGEICKALKFTGPINLQFKLNNQGEPKLTEINPRFSGGLPITAAAGISPVEVLLDLVQGRKIDARRLQWRETEADNEIMRRLRL